MYDLSQTRGFHFPHVRPAPGTQRPVTLTREPPEPLVLFHAPIRAREYTFRRLKALCAKPTAGGQVRSAGDDKLLGNQGAIKRWQHLEDIYAGRWHKVALPHCQMYGKNIVGLTLLPWRNLVPAVTAFPRWYPDPHASSKISLPLVDEDLP